MGLSLVVCFEVLFQVTERLKAVAFIFADPALIDFMQRHRVEIMELLASAPDHRDEVRRLQQGQMLGYGLPGHIQVLAQPGQSLAIALVELIQQFPPAFIGQRFEYGVHLAEIICNLLVACQGGKFRSHDNFV